jgi:putative ABC transport system permease protein
MTRRLAERLGLERGNLVRVETLEGKRAVFEVPIAATLDELVGISGYIDRRELARLMGEGLNVSGAYLRVEPQTRQEVSSMLKRLPAISSASYREATLRSFLDSVAKTMTTQMTSCVFFAVMIAFAVVYNSARIALSERGRDLATLRVLGFTRREVGMLLLGEQAIVTALGIPIGFVLGRLVAGWLVHLLATDEYRLTGTVSAGTYGFAFLIILAAGAISAAAVWRRIATLDLVEVLKTRE